MKWLQLQSGFSRLEKLAQSFLLGNGNRENNLISAIVIAVVYSLDSLLISTLAGSESLPSSVDELSMAIAGLQLLVPAKKQPGLLNEKIDYETSSTALGYVGHVSVGFL